MTCDEVIKTLIDYETELTDILSRFSRSNNGIYIQLDDDARLRQLAIELKDFLNDTLGNNSYSSMIANYYNEGVSRGSASYASVESIKGVASSVITRLKRNPKLLSKKPTASSSNKTDYSLGFPNRVTIGWLVQYVPVKYWIAFLGLLVAAFILGIQAGRISLVREVFKINEQAPIKSLTENKERIDHEEPNLTSKKTYEE